jgi:beta-galactosidase
MGPEENYVDRKEGARLGIFDSTPQDNLTRYIRPQECGNRVGVRWAEVTDKKGRGLRFTADGDPFELGVLPYTAHEMENARHPNELPPVYQTVVRLASKQMGVGGDDSWGARTHDEYLLDVSKPLHFSFTFCGITQRTIK